ncbi:hypothetical protein SESBI_43606 [Sesbania bispinosa]|nr:hypothetical protein SESBI_43606 [Sesbania bispinosa]
MYSFGAGGSKIINLLTSGKRLRTRVLKGVSDSGERRTEVLVRTVDSTQGNALLLGLKLPEASTKASPPPQTLLSFTTRSAFSDILDGVTTAEKLRTEDVKNTWRDLRV